MIEAIAWDGKTITEPGIYTGVSLEDYHTKLDLLDAPSVSKSSLKHLFPSLGGSPKQFWHLWKHNPEHIEPKETKALALGKAVHALFLGDEVFEDKFSVQPATYPAEVKKENVGKEWNNNATYCKEWNAEQEEAGKTIVTLDQMEQIGRMAKDIGQDEMVKLGVLNGEVERSMFVKDKSTGLWFKSRIDNQAVAGFWVDLKTTSSMSPAFIRRQIRDNGYFIQAAGARLAAREFGLPFNSFWNIYVSTGKTPDTQPVEIGENLLNVGEQFISSGLNTIAQCLRTGVWPGARPYDGVAVDFTDFDHEALQLDLKTPHLEQAA